MKNLIFSMLMITLFWSCAPMRDYQAPDVSEISPTTFETPAVSRFREEQPISDWWQQFNDPQLSALVEAVLQHNRTVQAAVANLDEARALAGATRRDRFPTVEAKGGVQFSRESNEGNFGPLEDRNIETYNASLDAFWELDLFGRVRNRIAASQAQVAIATADLRGIYVSIAAETASEYLALRGAQYRFEVATRNANNLKRTFELTQDLEAAGRSDRLDVVRAKTQLELTQATIPLIESDINASLNRLVVLTGRSLPGLRSSLAQAQSLPSMPSSVAVGDPIQLLQRRPDIAAAEQRLTAATAQYNLRVADLYPKVSLLGNLRFLSTSFGAMGSDDSFTAAVGPQIQWAAFNLGRVRDRIDAADAHSRAQLAHFEAAVLRALEETQTTMVTFNNSEASRQRMFEAAKASEEAVELARLRFEAGVDDFLDVLDAERTLLNAQERLARIETQTALGLIGVYKSLGGGWQVAPSQI